MSNQDLGVDLSFAPDEPAGDGRLVVGQEGRVAAVLVAAQAAVMAYWAWDRALDNRPPMVGDSAENCRAMAQYHEELARDAALAAVAVGAVPPVLFAAAREWMLDTKAERRWEALLAAAEECAGEQPEDTFTRLCPECAITLRGAQQFRCLCCGAVVHTECRQSHGTRRHGHDRDCCDHYERVTAAGAAEEAK